MYIGLAAAAGLVLVILVFYNRLVGLRNRVENATASIDVMLKQRCDLVPRLVDSVRASMQHEKGTLDRLTAVRERATAPGVPTEARVALDAEMGGLIRSLIARVEAYPDLKASANIDQLMRSLNEVEAQVAAARRTFNAAATVYNTAIETVPGNLVAAAFGFSRRPLFEATSEERVAPSVANLAS